MVKMRAGISEKEVDRVLTESGVFTTRVRVQIKSCLLDFSMKFSIVIFLPTAQFYIVTFQRPALFTPKSLYIVTFQRPALFTPKSVRLRIVLLMMFATFCASSLRTNLGVTIVCMVNATAFESKVPDSSLLVASPETDSCPISKANKTLEDSGYDGDLLWDSHTQGLMFSAISFGSIFTILPAGLLADRFGPKYIILLSLLGMGLMTYISPLLANIDAWAFTVSRFLLGMFNGFIGPAMTSVASRWFVADERSTMNALYTSGIQIAGILMGLTTPLLCSSKLLGGWPTVYYFYASVTVAWGVMWFSLASNRAENNKAIGDEEKFYIMQNVVRKDRNVAFPWRRAFASSPVWAILLIRITFITQQKIMMSYTASFVRDVLRAELHMNGIYTSLPFIAQIVTKNLASGIADYLKRQKILSQTASTRIFQAIASVGTAVCFLGLAVFADCNHVALGVTLLIFKNVFSSFISPGMHTSSLSIAPLHTGGLHSVTMFLAVLVSSGAPMLVGMIIEHNSKTEWSMIFLFLAALNILSGIFFAIFGSAEVQEWAMPKKIHKTFPAPPLPVSEVDTKTTVTQ
uniref:MFS domain-containing protein n=1 Tax=Steinernema glaseri TaxID=37863 RepID=A0A1I8A5U7_9BILA